MSVYIHIKGWSGENPKEAVSHLSKGFKFPTAQAEAVMRQLSEGKEWRFESPVSRDQGEKAYAFFKKIGFDVELVNAASASSSPQATSPRAPVAADQNAAADSRLLNLETQSVFILIILTIITLGIYNALWMLKRREAFNQLDSNQEVSEKTLQALLVIYIVVFVHTILSGGFGLLTQLGLVVNLAGWGAWIVLLVQAFKMRRILLDHCETNFHQSYSINPVLTFFFPLYFLQYKINGIHTWHQSRSRGPLVLRGDGLAWGMACLFLLIPIAGILAAIAIPQFNQYKTRAYNSDAKSNLHNVYLACKAFWGDNGSNSICSIEKAKGDQYGYVQSPKVEIEGSGTEAQFLAIAHHLQSEQVFQIDANGRITQR